MGKTGWIARMGILAIVACATAADPVGFQGGRRVKEAGRLDWEFVAGGAKLPGGYDSRRQRFQFFAPATYKPASAWPLVIWLSPGDDPVGWRVMEKACFENDWFFASPYGVGMTRPPGQRVRATLDVIDDVRRSFRIDPARTYIIGQGAASVLACQVAFSLPELFGGVAAIGGEAPIPTLSHLRHRLQSRLSVALTDRHAAGLYRDLAIRSRLWEGKVDAAMMRGIIGWMEGGRDARLADLRVWRVPGRADPTAAESAAQALERARSWIDVPGEQYRAAAVLEWLAVRHGKGETGRAARKLYDDWRAEPRKGRRLAEVIAADRRPVVRAMARAEERRGRSEDAFVLWMEAVRLTSDIDERERASKEADRIGGMLAKQPYLGMAFEGETVIVRSVEPGGPAYRAGLKPGDRLRRLGDDKVSGLAEIKAAAARLRPGDDIEVQWQRGDGVMAADLKAGSRLEVAKAKSAPPRGE